MVQEAQQSQQPDAMTIAAMAEKDKALWIFPVPGTPEGTKLDVVDSFPRFSGRDPRAPAAEAIGLLMMAVRATQIYHLIFEAVFLTHLGTSRVDASVHTHVEKWGIRSEAITADSLDSLVGYLQEKKAGVQKHLGDGGETVSCAGCI